MSPDNLSPRSSDHTKMVQMQVRVRHTAPSSQPRSWAWTYSSRVPKPSYRHGVTAHAT